ITDLRQWETWLTGLSIPATAVKSIGYAAVVDVMLQDVPLRITAHDVPELAMEAAHADGGDA
ncbi:hypothetical protein, partial [Escherichia coli]